MRKMNIRIIVLLSGLIIAGQTVADVTVPAMFSDHMVLQQGVAIPVWGWAEAGEKVVVTFGADRAEAVTGADGKWGVRLKAAASPGPGTMTIAGKNTITISDVLVGEVWVGSGQSNMQMSVKDCLNAAAEVASANYPQIRVFDEGLKPATSPQAKCKGKWKVCSPETAGGFSAVCYFFARTLHQEIKQPVGMVQSCWGGTPCEAWTREEVIDNDAILVKIYKRFAKEHAKYNERIRKWEKEVEKIKAANEANHTNTELPEKPQETPWVWPQFQPSSLYNGMLSPLIPYAIRGVIWYQGEGNVGNGYEYRTLFPAMITDWRKQWGQGEFLFLYVQLASFVNHKPGDASVVPVKGDPCEDGWAELREAQLLTLKLANTGMASAVDIGEANDIHPKNKQDVGRRLALWALAKTYGRTIEYSGPLYQSMAVEGNTVRLKFEHVGGGLEVRAANTAGADKLEGFAVAGADRKFVWADAKIEGDTVVVSAKEVAVPTAVRYGWAIYPICNLYNKAGLPASPFRTDDWPISSQGR